MQHKLLLFSTFVFLRVAKEVNIFFFSMNESQLGSPTLCALGVFSFYGINLWSQDIGFYFIENNHKIGMQRHAGKKKGGLSIHIQHFLRKQTRLFLRLGVNKNM